MPVISAGYGSWPGAAVVIESRRQAVEAHHVLRGLRGATGAGTAVLPAVRANLGGCSDREGQPGEPARAAPGDCVDRLLRSAPDRRRGAAGDRQYAVRAHGALRDAGPAHVPASAAFVYRGVATGEGHRRTGCRN